MPEPPSLAAVSLFVRDMAASVAFYRAVGLDVPEGAEAQHHVGVTLPNGLALELDTHALTRAYDPTWQPPPAGGSGVLQFLLSSREAVDASYTRLTGAGYAGRLVPFDAFWGARYAVVLDPDGNFVALTSAQDPARGAPMPPL